MGEKSNEKVGKKSKKKIIITVVIIVVLILLIAGGFIYYHGNQTGKLIAEVNKLSEIQIVNEDGTLVENPVDMEIKTTGSYAVVEKTLKDYINDVVVETQELSKSLDEEKVMNLVSFDNIKEDGPDFTNTKAEIATMRQAIDDYITKMEEYTNEENMLSKIDDKDVGKYYKELYKQLAVDEESSSSMKEAIEELKAAQDEAKTALDDLETLFNFLSDNKDEWEIQGEQIVFTTQSAYEEYTNLMSSLETMQQ